MSSNDSAREAYTQLYNTVFLLEHEIDGITAGSNFKLRETYVQSCQARLNDIARDMRNLRVVLERELWDLRELQKANTEDVREGMAFTLHAVNQEQQP